MRRRAFFKHDAEFVLDLLESARPSVADSISSIVVGIAASELARICARVAMHGIAAMNFADTFGDKNSDASALEILAECVDDHDAYQVDSSTVSAVVQSLLFLIDRTHDKKSHSRALCAAAAAAHDAGRSELLGRVLQAAGNRSHSPGYTALFAFYHTQLPAVRTNPSEFTRLRAECRAQLLAVKWSDPANRRVQRILRWMTESAKSQGGSAIKRAAAAAEAGNYVDAAHWFGLATGDAETLGQTGAFRLYSEIFKLRSGQLKTPSDFRLSMLRLANDHVGKAKPLLPVDDIFADYSTAAAKVDLEYPGSNIAAQVVDFIADTRMGVALDHNLDDLATVTKSLTDNSMVDSLQRDPQLVSLADLKTCLPDTSFVWVEIIHDVGDPSEPDLSGNYIRVLTLRANHDFCTVRDTPLTHQQAAMFTRTLNEESETAHPSELAWLGDLIFEKLEASDNAHGVCIMPDPTAWELPWMLIVPSIISQFAIVPSAAAAMRLQPPPLTDFRRVVSFFNPDMEGATAEHLALSSLHREHRIDYRSATSFAELRTLLVEANFDLLSIGAHGSFSSGVEFEFDFGHARVPLLSFLELPLPPVVNLGCCWSGRSSLNNNSIAASLATIAGGASLVLGGMWEIDDATSGALLADAYCLYADGHSFAQAVLAASMQLDPALRPLTGGLCLFGRW
ncbi:CHAT domain-containing protein [Nocardia sp. CA-119907]|uniref:CHAT domain-containing protein n=1 Tax=Nocardia sp. CA-119907 TaxID=3239973 RepID=UPI003D965110